MPRLLAITAVGLLVLASVSFAADTDLNRFKNFKYPFDGAEGWPHELRWQDVNEPEVTLVDGQWREPDNGSDQPFSGLMFESATLGDVTGDGIDNAVVVLRYNTGGTQYSHYVYIYSLRDNTPTLLAYFHSGDRATYGLYCVYAERRNLVVELFDPAKQEGDCCSDGFVRKRFQWNGTEFKQLGREQHGTPQAPSRLDVDPFGSHESMEPRPR
jgi:hypothetical protein